MRFKKLRLIWGILRGRTVIYNTKFTREGIFIDGDKAVIMDNIFDGFYIKYD